jgi:hypothetical protein
VIAFIRTNLGDYLVNAWIAFQGAGVDLNLTFKMRNAHHPVCRILKCNSTDDPVNLVSLLEQKLGKVGSILTCNSCYESLTFRHEFPVAVLGLVGSAPKEERRTESSTQNIITGVVKSLEG